MSMSWAEIVGSGAYVFSLEKSFIEALSQNEAYVGSVGATSRSYRKIVMQRFCYGLADNATDAEKAQQIVDRKVLIVLLTSLALTKKRARVARMLNTYNLTAQNALDKSVAEAAIKHLMSMPERASERSEKEGSVSLGATASCFPEVIIAFRCLISSYSRDVVTIAGQTGGQEVHIPWAWACPELTQLNWQPSCEQFLTTVDRYFWESVVSWPAGTAQERKWSPAIFKNKFADKYGFRAPRDILTMLSWESLGQLPATSQAMGITDLAAAADQDRKRAVFLSKAMEDANKRMLKALFDEEALGYTPEESRGGPPQGPSGSGGGAGGGRGSGTGQPKRPKGPSGRGGGGPAGGGGGAATPVPTAPSSSSQAPTSSMAPKAAPPSDGPRLPIPDERVVETPGPKAAPKTMSSPTRQKPANELDMIAAASGRLLPRGNLVPKSLKEPLFEPTESILTETAKQDLATSFPSLDWKFGERATETKDEEDDDDVTMTKPNTQESMESGESNARKSGSADDDDDDERTTMMSEKLSIVGAQNVDIADHKLCRTLEDYSFYPPNLVSNVVLSTGASLGANFMRFDDEDKMDMGQMFTEMSAKVNNLDLLGTGFSAAGWRRCMAMLKTSSGYSKADVALPYAMIQIFLNTFSHPDDLSESELETVRGKATTEYEDDEGNINIIDCVSAGLVPDISLVCEYQVLLRNRRATRDITEQDKDAVFWLAWGTHMIMKYTIRREYAAKRKEDGDFMNVTEACEAVSEFKKTYKDFSKLGMKEQRAWKGLERKAKRMGVVMSAVETFDAQTYGDLQHGNVQ